MVRAIFGRLVDWVSGVPSPTGPWPTIKEEWDRLVDWLAGVPPRSLQVPAIGVEPEAAEHAVPAVEETTTPLETYLAYYRGLRHPGPGYAVLVTGAFGSGKTHQVQRALPETERIYVSLFGVRSVEQLHAEVVAAANPSLEKIAKAAEQAGAAAKNLGGMFAIGAAASPVVSAMLRREVRPDRVLIFDDLERSSLDPKDRLGAINQYVEHRGFRVVVIAHDEAIAEKDPNAKKEKLFGQVIRIEPQTDQAFDSFLLRESNGRAWSFVGSHKNAVLDIFHESGEQSLRILRHVVEDLGRLARTLSDVHIAHEDAMKAVVALFTAFDIEVRNETIGPDDLQGRRHKIEKFGWDRASQPD
ncbi:MAG: KAP family NTPase, partial [Hyphomonas sp.]|nr:KAP family NTPase [Hyphomonas sp.]